MSVPLGTQWQEVKGSFQSKGDYFCLGISATAADEKPFTVWIDDLCLVEGEPTAFVPSAPVEVGLQGSSGDERYYRGKPINLSVLAVSYGKQHPVNLRLRIYDYYHERQVWTWRSTFLRSIC